MYLTVVQSILLLVGICVPLMKLHVVEVGINHKFMLLAS